MNVIMMWLVIILLVIFLLVLFCTLKELFRLIDWLSSELDMVYGRIENLEEKKK